MFVCSVIALVDVIHAENSSKNFRAINLCISLVSTLPLADSFTSL